MLRTFQQTIQENTPLEQTRPSSEVKAPVEQIPLAAKVKKANQGSRVFIGYCSQQPDLRGWLDASPR